MSRFFLGDTPAFPTPVTEVRSPWRSIKFLLLWPIVALIPAVAAYICGALFAAWLLRALGILTLEFWLVYRNVFHEIMVFGGELGELIFDLPDAAALVTVAVGTLAAASLAYRKRAMDWITSAARFRWRLMVWGAVLYGPIFALGLVVQGLVSADGYRPAFNELAGQPWQLASGLLFLPLILLLRAAAEEAVFRGWLMRQAQVLTRNIWIGVGVSAVLFALMHRDYEPGRVIQLLVAGVAFAWAAIRSGGLEWGIGLHAVWNLAIALVQDDTSISVPLSDGVPLAEVVAKVDQAVGMSALEWAILTALPLLAIVLTEVVVRDARLSRLVGLTSSAAAAPRPSA